MRYGTANLDYILNWESLPDRGAMWALNLMNYREQADYADGRETTITGQEADDLYRPEGPLAAVGASIVLVTVVLAQPVGDGAAWDRVAIARYPRRGSILDMQSLPEFQELHHHKDAGMASTIVAATFPAAAPGTPVRARGQAHAVVLQLVADSSAPGLDDELGTLPYARFDVEGVIVGDERTFAEARWYAVDEALATDLAGRERVPDTGSYVLLLQPFEDRMLELIDDAA